MFGSPSEETFFTLSYLLNTFVDQIIYLLTMKKFKYVLTSKINNDPIELCFCSNRYLDSHYLSLDISTFAHNEQILLL